MRFALIVGALCAFVLGVAAALLWLVLSALPEGQAAGALTQRSGLLLLSAIGVVFLVGFAVQGLYAGWLAPARRLAEELRLIAAANPGHRIEPSGPVELRRLAQAANALADRWQAATADVEGRIAEARGDLEAERNRLAALVAQQPQAVLVCNREHRILLYNERSRQLLGDDPEGSGEHLLGLGRSLHAIIDRDTVTHALEQIERRRRDGHASPVATFVTSTRRGQLLGVQLAAVSDRQGEPGGCVLTLEDVTRRVRSGSRRDVLLRSLIEGTRASLANLRAAVETITAYPDMDPQRREHFTGIVADEALRLSARIDEAVGESAEYLESQWPLEDMLGADLVAAVQAGITARWGIAVAADAGDEPIGLRVDSYALVRVLVAMLGRLREIGEPQDVTVRMWRSDALARLDLAWRGPVVALDTFAEWETASLSADDGIPLSLKHVAERHAGEVLYHADPRGSGGYLRLLLPVAAAPATAGAPQALTQQLGFYDFRLFEPPPSPVDDRALGELAYTVFDFETTGLDPTGGDEIIAVGAVRILGGRLLRHERFSQLVDPHRSVPAQSVRIHGLSRDMLRGRPGIDVVLPAFARFCEDTVLVGHNVAFDLRFVELKQEQTGVHLGPPVLDTLLLSAVVHPAQEDHSLEAIAGRLGIEVIGRHTALGDALLTAEILVKLLALLPDVGVSTLAEAQAACRDTYFAKLAY